MQARTLSGMGVKSARILAIAAGMALAAGVMAQEKPQPAAPVKVDPAQPAQPAPGQPVQPGAKPAGPIANAPVARPGEPLPPTTGPRITFDTGQVDFGQITDESPQEFEFRFTNTGTQTLTITNATGSCGCTVPALDKRDYAPGESGVIKVSFNPHNRRDAQNTQVTVSSNDPNFPNANLQIRAFVNPILRQDPMAVSFGQVRKGGSGMQRVTITSRREGLRPTGVTVANSFVQAQLGETKVVEQNGQNVEQTIVELLLPRNAPPGQFNGMIVVNTSDPARTLNVAFFGEVLGDVAFSPPNVSLGGIMPNQVVTGQVRLTSRDGKPFRVVKAEDVPQGSRSNFVVTVSEDASVQPPAYVITMTGAGPGAPGPFRGELVVTTDLADEQTVKVPYFGFVRAAPRQVPGAPATGPAQRPSLLVPQ